MDEVVTALLDSQKIMDQCSSIVTYCTLTVAVPFVGVRKSPLMMKASPRPVSVTVDPVVM